ncbi:MAG: serine hydrolase domain-containing protein [Armatimonadota bacterium]
MITKQQFDAAATCARGYVTSGNLAMVAISVSQSGGAEHRVAFGSSGAEEPGLCDRQFALASISKAITGVLTAILYEQGVLDYEASVVDYIPEFGSSEARRSIKLGQIFNHSTGLPSCFADGCAKVDFDPAKMLELLYKQELLDAPGTISRYSTHTFQLISEAIRRRLGLSMEAALRKYVFEPCGMTATSFYPDAALAMDTIDHPVPQGWEFEALQRMEMAGGGLWSTLGDLTKLGRAWLTPGKLVSAETFAKATTVWNPVPVVDSGGVLCRRTLGFNKELRGTFRNQPESGFFHGGATGTLWYMDPERDLVFGFMTNKWNAGNDQAFDVLGRLYE